MSPPSEERVVQKIPAPKMVVPYPKGTDRVHITKPDLSQVGKPPEKKFEPGRKPGVNAIKRPPATDRVIIHSEKKPEPKMKPRSDVQDVLDLPDSPRVIAEKQREQRQAQIYST